MIINISNNVSLKIITFDVQLNPGLSGYRQWFNRSILIKWLYRESSAFNIKNFIYTPRLFTGFTVDIVSFDLVRLSFGCTPTWRTQTNIYRAPAICTVSYVLAVYKVLWLLSSNMHKHSHSHSHTFARRLFYLDLSQRYIARKFSLRCVHTESLQHCRSMWWCAFLLRRPFFLLWIFLCNRE